MPHHRSTVRTRKPCRTCPHDRDPFARRCCAFKRVHPLGLQMVRGIALKLADLDRLALSHFTHTGLFTQLFGRTNAGTHAAHDILAQDRFGGSIRCARGDLPDEERNIDIRRAGRDARRVVTEVASVRRDKRFVHIQWRVQIGKLRGIGVGVQPSGSHPRFKDFLRHFFIPAVTIYSETLPRNDFFINW